MRILSSTPAKSVAIALLLSGCGASTGAAESAPTTTAVAGPGTPVSGPLPTAPPEPTTSAALPTVPPKGTASRPLPTVAPGDDTVDFLAPTTIAPAIVPPTAAPATTIAPPTTTAPPPPFTLETDTAFEPGSDRLTPAAVAQLESLLADLTGTPRSVRLDCHTDWRGDAVSNLTLSRGRCDAVRTWLVANGIPERVIQVFGHGETFANPPGSPPEVLQRDRRVDITVTV